MYCRMKIALSLLSISLLLSNVAFASHPEHKHKHKCPCKADKEKFCQNVNKEDHAAIHQCLLTNKDKLSEKCSSFLTDMDKLHEACKADKEKHCPNETDMKKVHKCMKNVYMKNKESFTQGCQDAIKSFKAKHKKDSKHTKKGK